jgi:hypothetical protein
MKHARQLLAITLAAAFGAAQAQELSNADARYLGRIDGRFAGFAGSSANLQSIALGLRHGEPIVLTETVVVTPPPPAPGQPPAPPTTTTTTTTIQPPTRPMGYGNVTRALDLASRQLTAAGITNPTASQVSAALNGGTVTTAAGTVTLDGVLQLRSQGMGWGKISNAIGTHPGMGSVQTSTAPASGITTAAGAGAAQSQAAGFGGFKGHGNANGGRGGGKR